MRKLNPLYVSLSVLALAVALGITWAVVWFLGEPMRQKQNAATATASATLAEGRATAAGQAVETVSSNAAAASDSDATTRKNTDDILAQDGARAPVAPGVYDAGLRARCLRDAYRDDPRCKRLLQARP